MCRNDYYTTNEVAYLLGVDTNTVRKWIRERIIKNVIVDRKEEDYHFEYRIPKTEIDDLEIRSTHYSQILEAKLLRVEIRDRLNRLEELEYQMYSDACFMDNFKNELHKIRFE